MKFLIAYVAAAGAFLALDFLWLSYAGERIYRPALGELMMDKPNLVVAAVFYLFYAAGMVVFAIGTEGPRDLISVAALGAFLGLIAYGTYDITNLSTLRGWPVHLTLIDMAWGAFATASASLAGALAVRAWAS
ncbi:hypothetical protein sos41_07420 [Alphaproteobacteria bacterium SO-S41]|nr:hypothetical protein sos41_07420 [Alphaproteobacteria bacterium SO-S41]